MCSPLRHASQGVPGRAGDRGVKGDKVRVVGHVNHWTRPRGNPRWVQVWFLMNRSVLSFRDLQEQRETRDIQEIQACLETLESQEGRATRG